MNKLRLLRHLLTPALLLIFLFGCTGGRQYCSLLEQADSLMATCPDSAYALTGKKLQQVDIPARGKQSVTINATTLTDGMYLMIIIP